MVSMLCKRIDAFKAHNLDPAKSGRSEVSEDTIEKQ